MFIIRSEAGWGLHSRVEKQSVVTFNSKQIGRSIEHVRPTSFIDIVAKLQVDIDFQQAPNAQEGPPQLQEELDNFDEFEEEVMESGTVASLVFDLAIDAPDEFPDRLLFGEDEDD